MKPKNILMVQDSSPCIRTIKISTALRSKGLNIHLIHKNRTPDEEHGQGNSTFVSIHQLGNNYIESVTRIKNIIKEREIDVVHYHNYPDKLGAILLDSDLGVPFIYDQHDFFSGKKRLSRKRLSYEKKCNENNDGAIFITENYKKLVAEKYKLNTHNITFPNYGLFSLLLDKEKALPKLSLGDNKIHLVYVGLITQHKNKVRNMIRFFDVLSKNGFVIHVYSTRNKTYKKYKKIRNVIIHPKMKIKELIQEISQYDAGIAFLNYEISDQKKVDEIKYGFWNKMYDYLMAGIPVITLNIFEDMAKFLIPHGFGLSFNTVSEIFPNVLQKEKLTEIQDNIYQDRETWTMENQIDRIIELYNTTWELYHAKT